MVAVQIYYVMEVARRFHVHNGGQQLIRYQITEKYAHCESFAFLMSGYLLSGPR